MRTPTGGDEREREQRPADRAEVVHRPLEPVRAAVRARGTTSASSAFRAGTRRPRAAQAPARRTPTCQAEVATPISRREHRGRGVAADRAAPAARVVGERAAGEARGPGSPSAIPSISPSAAAGAPRVEVRKLGSSAVGTSCPRSARRLAPPIPATPRVSQGGSLSSRVTSRLYAGD